MTFWSPLKNRNFRAKTSKKKRASMAFARFSAPHSIRQSAEACFSGIVTLRKSAFFVMSARRLQDARCIGQRRFFPVVCKRYFKVNLALPDKAMVLPGKSAENQAGMGTDQGHLST